MAPKKNKTFSSKHGKNSQTDNAIEKEILARESDGELACAIAFEISKTLNVSADNVGMNADLLNIKLNKCQLGLFGYEQNKIIKPLDHIEPDLKEAILQALENEKISCKRAWDIAMQFKMPKLTVGCACETLKIKISSCQLGAF